MSVSNRIDVFVFAHDESNDLNACIKSVQISTTNAREQGWSVALTLILRAATPGTAQWVQAKLSKDWSIEPCLHSELGIARNLAREVSTAQVVAFLDGSDLLGETWLAKAASAARREPAVWRPEALISFGDHYFDPAGYSLLFQSDAHDEAMLLSHNGYRSGFLASSSIVKSVPWPVEDESRGWGHVDWWWNCNVASAGYKHRIVPRTVHYRRTSLREDDSVITRIGPTPLAHPIGRSVLAPPAK